MKDEVDIEEAGIANAPNEDEQKKHDVASVFLFLEKVGLAVVQDQVAHVALKDEVEAEMTHVQERRDCSPDLQLGDACLVVVVELSDVEVVH